jgi:mannose-6-phosphate isomerase-like protein (cupin superfamily)
MPAHKHHGSDVILTPIAGFVRIGKDGETIDVHVGDAALVGKDEAVSLTNPGSEPARLLVATGPSSFVAAIRPWPEPQDA